LLRTATLIVLIAGPAGATLRYGPLQLSGNAQSQNLVRHPDPATYAFVQNRNTARIRLDLAWVQRGQLLERYDVPFIARSDLTLLWRGAYDSIYDTTPGFIEKEDLHGRVYDGAVRGCRAGTGSLYNVARACGFPRRVLALDGLSRGERDARRFENQLREAYVDLTLRAIPLTIRAGRQQIVWTETDNSRLLDRINPLDLTWHFQQEFPVPAFSWDELRRPLWMFKFLYDLGDVWKLSQSFLEWYWNPGDWRPAEHAFLPRPWGLRLLHPLTNPIDGAFIGGNCAAAPVKVASGPNQGLGRCTRLAGGTRLFVQGDYHRNPWENSQVGARYHGMTPQGLEFTLNYFHQRWSGDDGTDYAPLAGVRRTFRPRRDNAVTGRLIARGVFPAAFIAPYVHTAGASANFADETYTGSVLRFETVYDVGIPFFDLSRVTLVDNPPLPGVRKRNMWKGMIGFDRPTWIRPLNRRSTFLLTGQLFWHYLVGNPRCAPQAFATRLTPAAQARAGSCLVGALDLPSRARPSSVAFRDKIRTWEALVTFAATTFYRGGSVVPALGFIVDPVNQFSQEAFWAVDWVVRDDVVVNLAQRYLITPRGHATPIFETWGLGGLNAGRSETSLRVTYQF
jgi:hypothetical protein